MDGPRTILVSKASATHGRHWESEAHHIHPINRDHSRLVKFKPHDEVYDRLCCTLKEFVRDASVMNSGSTIEADERMFSSKPVLLSVC